VHLFGFIIRIRIFWNVTTCRLDSGARNLKPEDNGTRLLQSVIIAQSQGTIFTKKKKRNASYAEKKVWWPHNGYMGLHGYIWWPHNGYMGGLHGYIFSWKTNFSKRVSINSQLKANIDDENAKQYQTLWYLRFLYRCWRRNKYSELRRRVDW
jgi:hypothetical protein